MQLTVKPYHKNLYPRKGILVRGQTVKDWLLQVQRLGLFLEDLFVYPIPGTTANTVWGCLLAARNTDQTWPADIGCNVWCQCIPDHLFLPENSRLFPQLSAAELDKFLRSRPHLFHPETGWVELPDPIRWEDMLVLPAAIEKAITIPEESIYVPSRALAFYKQSLPSEEVLQNMEQELFPETPRNTKPLSLVEKIKLGVLRGLFGKALSPDAAEKKGWLSRLLPKTPKWMSKLQDSLDDLEERNNREVDKLLALFKKDPKEALKYAIPIDNQGVARGTGPSSFVMSRLWTNLTTLGAMLGGGGATGSSYGGSVKLGSSYIDLLNQEYRNTAQDLMKNKEYRQAAFIYLRLLKDYYSGADALEKAGLYAEAAAIYLKYANNKLRAAECYEKGQLIQEAIQLYQELQQDEKVGDLYRSIGKQKEARPFYTAVVQRYTDNRQYIKAAAILRDKLDEPAAAQEALLQGWREDRDAVNCLSWYFALINDPRQLEREIQTMYERDTDKNNRGNYLQVLKNQFDRHAGIQDSIRDLAQAIIAEKVASDPYIASELQYFNKKDKRLLKDILLFRQRAR